MTHLCFLAAGNGTRFGSNKLLAELCGRPVWRYGYDVLRKVQKTTGAPLHVVTRYSEILDAVGADGILCPDSALGLSYTVRAACAACGNPAPTDRLLFLAADQPRATEETVRKLMELPLAADFDSALPLAACAWDGERAGNPVVFSGILRDSLLQLTGDQGGKAALRAYPGRMAKVLCAPEELADIDCPEDLEKLKETL